MVFKALFEQMDKLEDLLPGIEDFLCTVLAKESLTPEAEEQRQYYIERLDIIKLPPSVPPRPNTLGLKLYPISNGTLPNQSSSDNSAPEPDDFAAYQRELSRALVAKGSKSPLGSGEEEVKVYDDIDSKDLSGNDGSQCHIEDEDSMYEIPKIKRNLSDSGYEKAVDRTSLSNICESTHSDTEAIHTPTMSQPPPLPPRRERTSSNAASRNSITSILEEKLGELNLKPEQQFTTSSNEGKQSEKLSDELLEDFTGDEVDAVSVDSMDQDGGVKLPRAMKKKRHHHKVSHSFSAPLCDISHSFCDLEDVMLSGELFYKSTLLSTKNMVALSTSSLVCYKYDKTECKPVLVIPLTGYRATFHKRHSRQSYEIQLSHDELEDHSFLTYFKEWAQTWCEYINCVAEGRKVTGPHYSLVRNRSMEPAYSSTYDLTKASSGLFGSSVSVCSYDGLETGTSKIKKRHNSSNRQRIGSIVSRASQILDSFKLLKKSSSSGPHYEDQTHIPGDAKNDTVIAYDDVKDKVNVKDTNKSESESTTKLKSRSDSTDKIGSKTDSSLKQRSKSETAIKADSMKKLSIPENSGKMSGSSMGSVSEKGSVSEPLSPLTPESGVFESSVIKFPTEVPKVVKHQGYLNIYSSFNKRKWGKRWCKVLENNFECYRNQTSTICELEFLLRGCILRRAIEETKSQLGLMLMENNREKVTVEPLTWTELGSWLRVLMKETSTPKPPEGLEGYMEDVNEYHDIIDDTRDLETDTITDMQLSPGCETTASKMATESKNTKSSSLRNSNRDSGNCSGESIDGRSEYLERTSLHPEFSDSSLPRVGAHKTGDIYTQVRKSSSVNIFENQKAAEGKSHAAYSNSEGEDKTHSNKVSKADDSHSIDFDTAEENLFVLGQEKSMVDEVLSRFTSHISGCFDEDADHEYEEFENVAKTSNTSPMSFIEREHIYVDIDSCKTEDTFVENRRLSRDLTEIEVISPIKETLELNSSDISKHQNFLCSSFVDDHQEEKDQVLSKSDQSQSKAITDGGDTFHLKADNSDHKSAIIGENDGNISSENSAVIAHANDDKENPQSKNSELCVEDLAHVLSNLSLEDKVSNETKIKGLTKSDSDETKDLNMAEKEIADSNRTDKDNIDVANNRNENDIKDVAKTGLDELGDKAIKASCDNDKLVPLEPELPNLLDEDARTRRSVVMREMAETGGDIDRTLKELRTKLVQLKKDRINIHDRMQLPSNNPRVHMYLEDEYNRLNREVEKVNEEIACIEELDREQVEREMKMAEKKKQIFDDDLEEIDV